VDVGRPAQDLSLAHGVPRHLEDPIDPLGERVEVLLIDRCRQCHLQSRQQFAARIVSLVPGGAYGCRRLRVTAMRPRGERGHAGDTRLALR
jgi:hypothetical protein